MDARRLTRRRISALIGAVLAVLTWPSAAQAASRPGDRTDRRVLPYYFLVASANSGKCLAVANASTDDGAPVVQQTCSETAYDQQWSFYLVDDVHYVMVVRHSGKCLAIADASSENAAQAVQQRCDGTASQQWSFPYVGGNNYLAVARHSGKCLTVAGGSTADGASVIQWTCRNRTYQQWRLGS
ncbi:RICIN domain-containing protein [Actinoplanes sp. NPDC049681]|uniref:RICIN domain-containing protein n=1 Tax=Actinoplanes sp. NPDC049681 TaxID=3363905 RepID=UPI0037924308